MCKGLDLIHRSMSDFAIHLMGRAWRKLSRRKASESTRSGRAPSRRTSPQGEADFAREVRGLPLARAISPADVAGAVLYLATAHNVTGQTIAVDAGQHLAWRTANVVL
jgi:NAD(P)-dependent dehydrogenase (short-subunit alcohol dehydrogenase family)